MKICIIVIILNFTATLATLKWSKTHSKIQAISTIVRNDKSGLHYQYENQEIDPIAFYAEESKELVICQIKPKIRKSNEEDIKYSKYLFVALSSKKDGERFNQNPRRIGEEYESAFEAKFAAEAYLGNWDAFTEHWNRPKFSETTSLPKNLPTMNGYVLLKLRKVQNTDKVAAIYVNVADLPYTFQYTIFTVNVKAAGDVRDCDVKDGDVKDDDDKDCNVRDGDVKYGDDKDRNVKYGDDKDCNVKYGDVNDDDVKDGDENASLGKVEGILSAYLGHPQAFLTEEGALPYDAYDSTLPKDTLMSLEAAKVLQPLVIDIVGFDKISLSIGWVIREDAPPEPLPKKFVAVFRKLGNFQLYFFIAGTMTEHGLEELVEVGNVHEKIEVKSNIVTFITTNWNHTLAPMEWRHRGADFQENAEFLGQLCATAFWLQGKSKEILGRRSQAQFKHGGPTCSIYELTDDRTFFFVVTLEGQILHVGYPQGSLEGAESGFAQYLKNPMRFSERSFSNGIGKYDKFPRGLDREKIERFISADKKISEILMEARRIHTENKEKAEDSNEKIEKTTNEAVKTTEETNKTTEYPEEAKKNSGKRIGRGTKKVVIITEKAEDTIEKTTNGAVKTTEETEKTEENPEEAKKKSGEKIGRGTKKVVKITEKAEDTIEKTEKTTYEAVKTTKKTEKIGEIPEEAKEKSGKRIERGTKKVGKTTVKAEDKNEETTNEKTKKTTHEAVKTTKKTGENPEEAKEKSGKRLKRGTKKVGKTTVKAGDTNEETTNEKTEKTTHEAVNTSEETDKIAEKAEEKEKAEKCWDFWQWAKVFFRFVGIVSSTQKQIENNEITFIFVFSCGIKDAPELSINFNLLVHVKDSAFEAIEDYCFDTTMIQIMDCKMADYERAVQGMYFYVAGLLRNRSR